MQCVDIMCYDFLGVLDTFELLRCDVAQSNVTLCFRILHVSCTGHDPAPANGCERHGPLLASF